MTSYCFCHFLFAWAIRDVHSSRAAAHTSFKPCISAHSATSRACEGGEMRGGERCQNTLPKQIVRLQCICVSEVVMFITFGEVSQPYVHLAAANVIYSRQSIVNTPKHKWIRAVDSHSAYSFLHWKSPRLSMLLQMVRLAISRANSVDKHQFCSPHVWCLPPLQLSTCWLYEHIFPTSTFIAHNCFSFITVPTFSQLFHSGPVVTLCIALVIKPMGNSTRAKLRKYACLPLKEIFSGKLQGPMGHIMPCRPNHHSVWIQIGQNTMTCFVLGLG